MSCNGFCGSLRSTRTLFQRPTDLFHCPKETAGADEPLDGFEVAVQGAIACEGTDIGADVLVCSLRALAGAQWPVELDPLGGSEQFAGKHAGCIRHDLACLAGRGC